MLLDIFTVQFSSVVSCYSQMDPLYNAMPGISTLMVL